MFENEIAINEFQLANWEKTVADLPEDKLFEAFPGHGHTPAWILGHLAIVGELGQKMLGGTIAHPGWLRPFGPGSDGLGSPDLGLTQAELCEALRAGYAGLRMRAGSANLDLLAGPHGVAFFEGTPLKTLGHAISVILTSHFGMHLSQLSSCRRTLGKPALF